jgi:hypothetical protein
MSWGRFLWVLLALSCGHRDSPEAKPAFYFWRTRFELSAPERDALARLHANRLYLRFFDIAWQGEPVPVGEVTLAERPPPGVEVVPVLYVANAIFQRPVDPEALAEKAWARARGLARNGGFDFREIQLDCDWSDSTRDAYFAFARTMRRLAADSGVRVSATIRLHQVKYRQRTGVPPVDRGMLMFYNVGRLEADPARSSVFNLEDAERYTATLDTYPLPLDAVLPIFSWAIHSRAGSVVGLMEKPESAALDAAPALRRTSADHYAAQSSGFFNGSYLREGDQLAIESVPADRLRQAALALRGRLRSDSNFTVAFFDLDERNLHAHPPEELGPVAASVR